MKQALSQDQNLPTTRLAKKPRFNAKFEHASAFLAEYFSDENGRVEKLPNPRYGRDEYRLPVWLSMNKIYMIYENDNKNTPGKGSDSKPVSL